MDRFKPPTAADEPQPIGHCANAKCGEELGESYWELNGEKYCSAECLAEDMGGERVVA